MLSQSVFILKIKIKRALPFALREVSVLAVARLGPSAVTIDEITAPANNPLNRSSERIARYKEGSALG
ncbi:hypothetical protein JTE90_025286 [Oedothorax gibbosus]|uniref:Uncharacterized protein n=1 Tax=Oedothorax gibbosus TaxID=931172 RepID=A0AAV6TJ38_9ARAC|nr:hypothetical protein JTE90_025286 [Oedothorax gibbosus]